ncbi:MAG: hypothetical protein ACRCUT_12815 [Spirochaetota bacterium]
MSAPADDAQGNEEQQEYRNVNVDMQLTYGQYNNMFSAISLSHEQDDFVYLLTSNFKRSNDYGYNGSTFQNTSFYENKIGFTGNYTVTDSWKSMFEAAVDNDSHGMYANTRYSREEKGKFSLSVKNTVRASSSFEWYAALNYSGYSHRLSGRVNEATEKGSLNKCRGEIGGEKIWSGSNRIRGSVLASFYDYSDPEIRRDVYVKGEIIDDFKLTTRTGVSLGMEQCWNRDSGVLAIGHLPDSGSLGQSSGAPLPLNPYVSLSYTGSKYLTASVMYKYDMENFRPENFYLEQKYVLPRYDLPPAEYHLGEGKVGVKVNDILTLKSSADVRQSDVFYNYSPVEGDVLSVEVLPVFSAGAKAECLVFIPKSGFQFSSGYEYIWYYADDHVTYRPSHLLSESLKYTAKQWNFEWTNKFASSVYISPDVDEKLPRSVIGFFGIQLQLVNGLYSYFRIENLYNTRYYIRDGYPESGVTVLCGLRILI